MAETYSWCEVDGLWKLKRKTIIDGVMTKSGGAGSGGGGGGSGGGGD